MGLLAKLFRRREPKTHDISARCPWIRPESGGATIRLGDWCFFRDGDPVPGDYVILGADGHRRPSLFETFSDLPGPGLDSSKTTRYRVTEFKRMHDPRDQWFMTAEFAPRSKENT